MDNIAGIKERGRCLILEVEESQASSNLAAVFFGVQKQGLAALEYAVSTSCDYLRTVSVASSKC